MKRIASGPSTTSYNLALLVIRVWFGMMLFSRHGFDKLMNFSRLSTRFADPLHVGSKASLVLVILAEVVCSLLVVVGLGTRVAAAIVVIDLGVAFAVVHHFRLVGQGNGEMAFMYIGGFLALIIAGAGRWSIDALRHRG
jgi:putative oxidoreductase